VNKTALVTGGAIRIGRSICLMLADAGWDIAIHYRSSEQQAKELAGQITSKGRKAHLVQADLRDEASVSDIIPSLVRKGVLLECLINNASLFEKNSFAELTPVNWHDHMSVNCFAPLQLIRDFASHYKGETGNVINITDGLKGWSMSPVFFSYTMSKLALANATELLARTLAPRIRINAIAPGAMLESIHDKEDTFDKLRKVIPMKRTGTSDEIGDTIRYVIATPSLTGQTIMLSGGIHTMPPCSV
jgi:NAD(P)-dependent dehydrogenase (short-subunit alcohol dehydrogenase family)